MYYPPPGVSVLHARRGIKCVCVCVRRLRSASASRVLIHLINHVHERRHDVSMHHGSSYGNSGGLDLKPQGVDDPNPCIV